MDSPNKREWGEENDMAALSFNQAKDGLLWVAVLDGQGGAELRKGGWTNNNCLGPPGCLSGLSVLHRKLVLCMEFLWARRALNCQKRHFSARTVSDFRENVLISAGRELAWLFAFCNKVFVTECKFTSFLISWILGFLALRSA
jgi:hypothetical protein